ncbi:low molecular weight protein-tyrosine-phosphatase [uncultured Vibrio sp.]|uniref:low molecular weight protein-tyrosine-phosphatase n=1 Tax=uncultured Vibrio sp. TaxID=114054 RepID=UPI0025DFEE10|nr:low molecular weight protein-tyrosine-phosphatase [uncultured Vibrio sp.]
MFNKILIVCTGNICRSPIAESLFESVLPNKFFQSAGIAVKQSNLIGASAHPSAIEVAADNGIVIGEHKAQQLTENMCLEADLILVMSHEQIDEVTQVCVSARSKTMLIGQWIGIGEILDPIRCSKESFEEAYHTIGRAVASWHAKLQ